MQFNNFFEQLAQAVDQLEEHYQDNPFVAEVKHPSEAQRKAMEEASKAFNRFTAPKHYGNTPVVVSPEFDTLIREGKEKHLKVFEIAPSTFTEEDFDKLS